MNFKGITDLLNMPLKIIGAVMITTGLVLFIPDNFARVIFLLDIREEYGPFIGIVFLTTTSILVLTLIIFIWKIIATRIKNKLLKRKLGENLRNLDAFQQAIVYQLYITTNNVIHLPIMDGTVKELENKLIINKSTNTYNVDLIDPVFPYFLQMWVSEELNKDSGLRKQFVSSYEKHKEELNRYSSRW